MKLSKKLSDFIIIIIFFYPLCSLAQGSVQYQSREDKGFLYFGGIVLPFKISGVEDIHASDWQNYGLGELEGRVALPLSSAETSGLHKGVMAGYQALYKNIPVLIEIQYVPESGSSLSSLGLILFGINIKIGDNDVITIGIKPKVGLAMGNVNFGEVELLPNKTPPVITPEGTFYVGDNIKAVFSGVCYQIAGDVSYKISNTFKLFGQLGITIANLGELDVIAGEVVLKKDSPALVKNDFTSTQAGIDPNVSSNGIYLNFGLSIKL